MVRVRMIGDLVVPIAQRELDRVRNRARVDAMFLESLPQSVAARVAIRVEVRSDDIERRRDRLNVRLPLRRMNRAALGGMRGRGDVFQKAFPSVIAKIGWTVWPPVEMTRPPTPI